MALHHNSFSINLSHSSPMCIKKFDIIVTFLDFKNSEFTSFSA